MSRPTAVLVVWFIFLTVSQIGSCEALRRDELDALAKELAPRVDLFAEVWRAEPTAEIFGGTSRDFLFWILGQFREAKTSAEKESKINELRSLASISVSEFISPLSDVDIIGDRFPAIDLKPYKVKKLDLVHRGTLEPMQVLGKAFRQQGYLPAEMIRISKHGVVSPSDFGDGLAEIANGKFSAKFATPEEVENSYFGTQKMNHPILLSLRYVRLLSKNAYARFGTSFPDPETLKDIPDDVEKAIQATVNHTIPYASKNLKDVMRNPWMAAKVDETVHKAFGPFANPTLTRQLMHHFGIETILADLESLRPISGYEVAKREHDVKTYNKRLNDWGLDPLQVYQEAKTFFPDGKFYHGVRPSSDLNAIQRTGFRLSKNGFFGSGLYGVAKEDLHLALTYAGVPDRIISVDVREGVRVVDLTEGEGRRAWEQFKQRNGSMVGGTRVGDPDDFAEWIGADILKFPFHEDSSAFVVKDLGALKQLTSVSQPFVEKKNPYEESANAIKHGSDFLNLLKYLQASDLSESERDSWADKGYVRIAKQIELTYLGRIWDTLKTESIGDRVSIALAINTFFSSMLKTLDYPQNAALSKEASSNWKDLRKKALELEVKRKDFSVIDRVMDRLLAVDPRFLAEFNAKFRKSSEKIPSSMGTHNITTALPNHPYPNAITRHSKFHLLSAATLSLGVGMVLTIMFDHPAYLATAVPVTTLSYGLSQLRKNTCRRWLGRF